VVSFSAVMDETLSIGEVATRSGISSSALRFYESQGLVHATRSDGGQRRYERDVLRRLAFIRVAQRVGLTLDEVRSALSTLPDQRTPTAKDWARLSRAWRPRLDEQISVLMSLRDQLSSCIGCGCLSLRACSLYNPEDGAAALGTGPRYLLGDSADDVI
jgi:MerR family redox-sensitive transcriptional activator SoxR